jgi:polar amino acid transport system substrate-binding protein
MRFITLLMALLSGTWAFAQNLHEPGVLTVAFNNKPPFFYFEAGEARGILVEQAKQVFQRAKIPHQFEELPFNRVMLELERKRPMFAALGFSKTPERESFVTFSKPLYRDRTPVILVRAADADSFRTFGTLQQVIDSGRFTFGGKQGNAYPIDPQLRTMGANDRRFIGEALRLPELLVFGRFDFTLLFPEELPVALALSAVSANKVQQISYPDIAPGGYRYLLFSTTVPAAMVEKINQAITAVIPSP